MNTPIDYIEAVKSYLELDSDYAASAALGLTRAAISRIRIENASFDNFTAMQIAALLNISPMEPIAAAEYHRAKNDTKRDFWRRVWEQSGAGVRIEAERLRGWKVGTAQKPNRTFIPPSYPFSTVG
jgi:hypothetical protein